MHDPVVREILKSSRSWDGAPLKAEFRVLHFTMAPGATTTIHMHPLSGAGYVIRGELTMVATEDPHGNFREAKRVKEIKLRAGDAWTEMVNTWHYGVNQGAEDLEFVLIFTGEEGTPPTLSLNTKHR